MTRHIQAQPKQSKQPKQASGRMAYVCEKCSNPTLRVFLKPGEQRPRCERHGAMTLQPNHPYCGRPT